MTEPSENSFVSTVMTQLGAEYEDAQQFAESYQAKMQENPGEALAMLETYIEESRRPGPNREHRAFVEAVAGGPNPDYIVPIINVVGETYSGLDPEQRQAAGTVILKHLDELNFINAQGHLEQLDNSELLADILYNRPFYWPGFRVYTDFLKNDPSWAEVVGRFESAPSCCLFGIAVLYQNGASAETGERFREEYPQAVDGAVTVIAARADQHARRPDREDGASYYQSLANQLERYDPEVQPMLLTRAEDSKALRVDLDL